MKLCSSKKGAISRIVSKIATEINCLERSTLSTVNELFAIQLLKVKSRSDHRMRRCISVIIGKNYVLLKCIITSFILIFNHLNITLLLVFL